MEILIGGCLAFLATHLGVSGTPLRSVIKTRIGGKAYLVAYSLASFTSLGVMIFGYGQAIEVDVAWHTSTALVMFSKALVLVAFIMVSIGVMTPNPTALGFETVLGEEIKGMLKITRHPLQWGILMFAIAHLISNSDAPSLILFGTLAVVSFVGMLSIDARRRSETELRWQFFMGQTSTIPFAAVLRGRQKLEFTDFQWIGAAVGIVLYSLIYFCHDWVSGGSSLI